MKGDMYRTELESNRLGNNGVIVKDSVREIGKE
jgi:hypothetical protein